MHTAFYSLRLNLTVLKYIFISEFQFLAFAGIITYQSPVETLKVSIDHTVQPYHLLKKLAVWI